jgi:hypothetical protein
MKNIGNGCICDQRDIKSGSGRVGVVSFDRGEQGGSNGTG